MSEQPKTSSCTYIQARYLQANSCCKAESVRGVTLLVADLPTPLEPALAVATHPHEPEKSLLVSAAAATSHPGEGEKGDRQAKGWVSGSGLCVEMGGLLVAAAMNSPSGLTDENIKRLPVPAFSSRYPYPQEPWWMLL